MPTIDLAAEQVTALVAIIPNAIQLVLGFVVSAALVIGTVVGGKFIFRWIKGLLRGRM